jgi:hypothetical protein
VTFPNPFFGFGVFLSCSGLAVVRQSCVYHETIDHLRMDSLDWDHWWGHSMRTSLSLQPLQTCNFWDSTVGRRFIDKVQETNQTPTKFAAFHDPELPAIKLWKTPRICPF